MHHLTNDVKDESSSQSDHIKRLTPCSVKFVDNELSVTTGITAVTMIFKNFDCYNLDNYMGNKLNQNH